MLRVAADYLAASVATFEPHTETLLLNKLTPEQCRVLFPKTSNSANQERSRKITALLTEQAQCTSTDELRNIIEEIQAVILSAPGDSKGLRPDAQVILPDSEECW